MKSNLTKLLLAICCVVTSLPLLAQPGGATPDPNILPGQSSLSGISNIYSTNFYDGTVNVNIPIFDYAPDGRQFGVSLSYNTRGILVDETVGAAGLHWNLLAESRIDRVIKDIPDELNYIGEDSLVYYNGLGDEFKVINKSRYVKGKLATYWETTAQQNMANVYRDGETDDFMVSIGGRSFTFNLGKDLYVFTNPKNNVKVKPMLNGNALFSVTNQNMGMSITTDVLEFELTDENGDRYYFVAGDYEMKDYYSEHWLDNTIMVSCKPITRWVIKKITFADGRVIAYNYTDLINSSNYYSKYLNYFVEEKPNGAFTVLAPKTENFTGGISQLLNIKYPNGTKVNFTYSSNDVSENGTKMLNEIQIESQGNCLRYLFQRVLRNQRWVLDKIRFASCDNTKQEPYYSFEYNPLVFPKRLHPAQDHYGYYNGDSIGTAIGSSGNRITIPKHNATTGFLNYGISRTVNPNFAKAGLLTSVKNGFGGEVSFRYSGNNISSSSLTGLPTGEKFIGTLANDGLKVDSIIEKEKFHPNNKRISVITYSLGQLFLTGGYYHSPDYINSQGAVTKEVFQSLYLTSHQFVNGSNHGYGEVGIKTVNEAGLQLYRQAITYTNFSDITSNSQPRYYRTTGSKHFYEYPYTNKNYIKGWEMGLPLQILNYDQNNRLVTATNNTYNFSAVDLSAAPYISNTRTAKVDTGVTTTVPANGVYYANKVPFTDTYTPFTGTANLARSVHKKYVSDTRIITDTMWYEYDYRNNLSAITTFDSKGDKTLTAMVYNYNVDGPDVSLLWVNPGSTLYNMTNVGLEKVVSMERWKLSSSPLLFNNKLLSAFITKYQYQPGKIREKAVFNMNNSKPLTYTEYTGLLVNGPAGTPYSKINTAYNATTGMSNYQKTNDISLYDSAGNALEISYINDKEYVSLVWDTITGKKLAEVRNARYNDIGYTSFEDVPDPYYYVVRGNIDLNQTKVINVTGSTTLTSVTGKYIYHLSPPPSQGIDFSDVLGKKDLSANVEYILSFWVNGTAPKVYIGTVLLTAPSSPAYTKGTWKNYQYRFTPTVAGKIKISPTTSTTTYLDEIRLYPATATMLSWTYEPLFGESSATDPTGRITYTEYDPMGRQAVVRDQEGYIIMKTKQFITGGN